MTLEQLQAKRDEILTQLAGPDSVASGDKSIRNRTGEDLRTALSLIDTEIRRLEQGYTRVSVIEHSRE